MTLVDFRYGVSFSVQVCQYYINCTLKLEQANPDGRLIVSSTAQQTKKLTFSSAANPRTSSFDRFDCAGWYLCHTFFKVMEFE
ncbi:hypothetical protein DPMN_071157 [Dreissena polymorpha]|uniref:Uncharacterized protein n=1 Tax=Dreissena polymorpha TaxID=45954 RepID=A0A9D3Z1S6_DREPO|nr:hypothetical protein DPMN_071157 [Dreissena polymorpha]